MNNTIEHTIVDDPQNVKTGFEAMYLAVREQEQRVYTDAQVILLPEIERTHLHYHEWQVRKRSAEYLISYLKKKQRPLNILEIGCGNGWLSAEVAKNTNFRVTGLDINQTEISQALRVFKSDNLQFICDAFNGETFEEEKFDIVFFAAVLSYFPSVQQVIQIAVNNLTADGEVHILDTHFYEPAEVEKARERCINYYHIMGFPKMADHYFHYTLDALKEFRYRILSDPRRLINRLKKKRFYWISIKG